MEEKLLLLDLDGTLIETVTGHTFPKGCWDMKFKEGILDAIKNYNPSGVFICSNQGGIAKSFVNEFGFIAKSVYIRECIQEYTGISLVDYAYCTNTEKDNEDRKPNIGMFKKACAFFNVHTPQSYLMVGDASGKPGNFSDSDKVFADNAGCKYMDVEDFIALYGKQILK